MMAKRVTTKTKTTRRRQRPAAETNGHIQDGELVLVVEGGPHDGKTIKIDPMLFGLESRRLERQHKLEVVDGVMIATADFAKDLQTVMQRLGHPSTPTIAVCVWVKVCEYFAEQQKKTS
jgi:hypothetical protein